MLMPSAIPAGTMRWHQGAVHGRHGRDRARVCIAGSREFRRPDCWCDSACDRGIMKEYHVFVLTPEGYVLDRHTLTCVDDEEAKETVKVLADSNTVEIWNGPVRVVRFEPMQ